MVNERVKSGRARLDAAVEVIRELCEPVSPPKREIEYRNYFCARNLDNKDAVKKNEPRRKVFFDAIAEYSIAYSELADELETVGYSHQEAASIQKEVRYFEELRGELVRAAG